MPKPIHIHDVLRMRVHSKAGLIEKEKNGFVGKSFKDLDGNWSEHFLELMKNRMRMGALRYGHMNTQRFRRRNGTRYDIRRAIMAKVNSYLKTGNTEHLVDAANYMMLVFELDEHPNKHFRPLDDHHDHCPVI